MSYADDVFELGSGADYRLPSEFDGVIPDNATPGELLALLRQRIRARNAADAAVSGVAAALFRARAAEIAARGVDPDARPRFLDDWALLRAEFGAASGETSWQSAKFLNQAAELCVRMPCCFGLHARGHLTARQVGVILRLTAAITDEEICRAVDARLAELIDAALTDGTDVVLAYATVQSFTLKVIAQLDPDALPELLKNKPKPYVAFTALSNGMAVMEGLLTRADAIRLSDLIDEVAATACMEDGRRIGERKAAALVALAEGYVSLGCQCERDGCEFAERRPRTGAVAADLKALAVVVLSEAAFRETSATPDTGSEARPETAPGPMQEGTESASEARREKDDGADDDGADNEGADNEGADDEGADDQGEAAIITNNPDLGGPVPARLAREFLGDCNTATTILGTRDPVTGEIHVTGSNGYRPTDHQLLIMRLIYPHCMFPGCRVASAKCQADHVQEYDPTNPGTGGQTTVRGRNTGPGNLVPLCVFHHLIKTHDKWLSVLLTDGSVEWHHPAGGIFIVPVGGTDIPGIDALIWDFRHPENTADQEAVDPDAFTTRTRIRNAQRQQLRQYYCRARERKRQEKRHRQEQNGPPGDPPF
jgi:hypothetical protein